MNKTNQSKTKKQQNESSQDESEMKRRKKTVLGNVRAKNVLQLFKNKTRSKSKPPPAPAPAPPPPQPTPSPVKEKKAAEKAKPEKQQRSIPIDLCEQTCKSYRSKALKAKSKDKKTKSKAQLQTVEAKTVSVEAVTTKKSLATKEEDVTKDLTTKECTATTTTTSIQAPNPQPPPVDFKLVEISLKKMFDDFSTKPHAIDFIDEQWDQIEEFVVDDDKCKAFLANEEKNQAEEVECLDANRVKINRLDNKESDYIHASNVEVKSVNRKFVLAQLPRVSPKLLEDFWTMVYQERVHNIFLLCTPSESTKSIASEKFGEYLPISFGQHEYYGQIWVNNRKVELACDSDERPNDVIHIEVLPEGCAESVAVTVTICSFWPEGSVPTSTIKTIHTATNALGTIDSYENYPIGIVSKRGAGRTGTFLAIVAAIELLKTGAHLSIKDIGYSIRSQRPGAIDTRSQFIYVYYVIFQYSLHICKDSAIKTKLQQLMKELKKSMDEDNNETANGGGASSSTITNE